MEPKKSGSKVEYQTRKGSGISEELKCGVKEKKEDWLTEKKAEHQPPIFLKCEIQQCAAKLFIFVCLMKHRLLSFSTA